MPDCDRLAQNGDGTEELKAGVQVLYHAHSRQGQATRSVAEQHQRTTRQQTRPDQHRAGRKLGSEDRAIAAHDPLPALGMRPPQPDQRERCQKQHLGHDGNHGAGRDQFLDHAIRRERAAQKQRQPRCNAQTDGQGQDRSGGQKYRNKLEACWQTALQQKTACPAWP